MEVHFVRRSLGLAAIVLALGAVLQPAVVSSVEPQEQESGGCPAAALPSGGESACMDCHMPGSLPDHALGWGVMQFDADGDGDLDLFVTNGHLFDRAQVPPCQDSDAWSHWFQSSPHGSLGANSDCAACHRSTPQNHGDFFQFWKAEHSTFCETRCTDCHMSEPEFEHHAYHLTGEQCSACHSAEVTAEPAVSGGNDPTTRFLDVQLGSTIVVEAGDTLHELARRTLGSAERWRELAELNGLSEIGHLRVGQRLRVPGAGSDPLDSAAADPRVDEVEADVRFYQRLLEAVEDEREETAEFRERIVVLYEQMEALRERGMTDRHPEVAQVRARLERELEHGARAERSLSERIRARLEEKREEARRRQEEQQKRGADERRVPGDSAASVDPTPSLTQLHRVER